jgi:hypothetical protein
VSIFGIICAFSTALFRRAADPHYRLCSDLSLPFSSETQICDAITNLPEKFDFFPRVIMVARFRRLGTWNLVVVYLDSDKSWLERQWFPLTPEAENILRFRDSAVPHWTGEAKPTQTDIEEFSMAVRAYLLRAEL